MLNGASSSTTEPSENFEKTSATVETNLRGNRYRSVVFQNKSRFVHVTDEMRPSLTELNHQHTIFYMDDVIRVTRVDTRHYSDKDHTTTTIQVCRQNKKQDELFSTKFESAVDDRKTDKSVCQNLTWLFSHSQVPKTSGAWAAKILCANRVEKVEEELKQSGHTIKPR